MGIMIFLFTANLTTCGDVLIMGSTFGFVKFGGASDTHSTLPFLDSPQDWINKEAVYNHWHGTRETEMKRVCFVLREFFLTASVLPGTGGKVPTHCNCFKD
jgi:hypothetical protein